MGSMARCATWLRHGSKRSRPAELVPGTVSCISARMDYWPGEAADAQATLADGTRGYISRYALGRDYHKLMRRRLQMLCDRIRERVGTIWASRLHRQCAGSGKGAGTQRRPGLDRQAHESDRPRGGFVFLSRRDLPRPGAAAGRGRLGALRLLQRLYTGLSDRRDRRALPPRRPPLHLLSHDRTRRFHSRRVSPLDRQSHLRMR